MKILYLTLPSEFISTGLTSMKFFWASAGAARHNSNVTAKPIANMDAPEILIVAPPPCRETANPVFAAMFAGAADESAMLASLYRDLADEMDCSFFDAGSVAQTTPLDGVHLDAENTRAIGRGLEPVVRMLLGI